MARIYDKVQDGKDEIAAAFQRGGLVGPHWTLWEKEYVYMYMRSKVYLGMKKY